MNCCIRFCIDKINDDKYNICGCYHSDSCWCSARKVYENPFDNDVVFNYCLIPLTKLLKSAKHKFHFNDDVFIGKKVKTTEGNAVKYTYTLKATEVGKTYYFKVRAYKTVDGAKVYGATQTLVFNDGVAA